MVDSQTSPMSSPTDNTSRRNSFAGDSFIKIKDLPATGPTYRKIYLSELADLVAEILKDQKRATGSRVISYIYNKIDSRFKNCRESITKVIPPDKSLTIKIQSGTGDPPIVVADPGCPPPPASGTLPVKKKHVRLARTPAKLKGACAGHKLGVKSPHHK
ncbi:hypothetical protein DPMN_057777 [Dreissena polymorpha]|uniref:Uncharacterized protein n=1 Tax=Dreissena polymorpha TaxID=45954 RepID=A0A9D4C0J3_DREPO|nr:hypothetical protein DPMN_057777 [Dreissena polymorpha]